MSHYDKAYYDEVYAGFEDQNFSTKWALGCAIVGGYADKRYESALEYGAGLGQNLEVLSARRKWAVDINETSRLACQKKNIEWCSSLDMVPDASFDMILARHSLEHVPDPLDVLRRLRSKATRSAELFLIVPFETSVRVSSLSRFDEHRHLFSWSPETLKNLLLECGWLPHRIHVHNGVLLPRMTSWLPRFRKAFVVGRTVLNLLPWKSAEILASARVAS